jgi:hypothetical protein
MPTSLVGCIQASHPARTSRRGIRAASGGTQARVGRNGRLVPGAATRARRQLRVAESIPILDKIEACLAALARTVLPKSSLAKAVTYARNQWQALRRYTEDGRLTIDSTNPEPRPLVPDFAVLIAAPATSDAGSHGTPSWTGRTLTRAEESGTEAIAPG